MKCLAPVAVQGAGAVDRLCDDDALGETAEVVWKAELDPEVLGHEGWETVARSGTDDPAVFAAELWLKMGDGF